MNKIGKFFREVLVIVIGIAITLYASHWLSNRSEKRDVVLYLNAIKLELEGNIQDLQKQKEWLQKEVEYANYLKLNDINSVNLDTIFINYGTNFWGVRKPNCNNYSFEMFKLSGTMRFIKDKELLLTLWAAYSNLDQIRHYLLEDGFQSKIEEIKQEMSLLSQTIQDGKLTAIPMYNYYHNTIWPDNMLQNCIFVLELLEKTVLWLNET